MSQSWTRQKERGSSLLLRFMLWLTLTFGWWPGRLLLYPITVYFFVFSSQARLASARYLSRALGRPPLPRDIFRHYFTFASTILDRPFLLTARLGRFDIRVHGLAALKAQIDAGRGCILLGAHFGSFEVLRTLGEQGCPVPVKVLMYEKSAARVQEVLQHLNPARPAGVIPIGRPDSMLRVKEALDAGELVGILADRSTRGDKTLSVPFLGKPAPFPVGPLVLASVVRAPVFLFFGIHTGGRRYDIHFEPFAEAISLGRDRRLGDLESWIERYKARLESRCRMHPYNWFNFYHFWGEQDATDEAQSPPAHAAGRLGPGHGGMRPRPRRRAEP